MVEIVQLVLHRLQPLGHLAERIVDTGEISTGVCAKRRPVGHLAFQQERIFLFPSVKLHRHSKAPITANRHRVGPLDLLAGVQQRRTGILLIGEGVATDFHAGKAVLRVRVFRQRFHIRFQPGDKALIFFDLLREGFQ